MDRGKLLWAAFFVLFALAFLYTSVSSFRPEDGGEPHLELLVADKIVPAVDFTLPEMTSGKEVHLLEEAKHHPIVLSFWATWCGPCKQELPHLQLVSQRYAGRVAFYGVDSDDPPTAILPFAQQMGLTFSQLSDARQEVKKNYGIQAIPMLVVIDTQGKVRAAIIGLDTQIQQSLPKVLDTILGESSRLLPTKAG